MASDESVWFGTRSTGSVRDFVEICAQSLDDAGGVRGALAGGHAEPQVADLQASLRSARAGDWRPFERHLRSLGLRDSRAGLAITAWYAVARTFSDAFAARAVAAYATQPARLTAVLLTHGEAIERALCSIASGYYAVKQQREHEVLERNSRMIDAALDAVIEIDEHGLVTEWNPVAERTFRYRKADAIGQPLATLIIPERLRERHRAGLARLVATGAARLLGTRVAMTAMRADGSELPVELALALTVRLDGSRSFTGFVRDLTEQQRAEEALAVRAHALEQAQTRLEILSNTAHEFAASSGEIDALLALVARRLGEIIGEGCAVRLISADGAWLEPSTSVYHRDPERQELARQVLGTNRQRVGDGLAGQVAASGVAILLPVVDPEQGLALVPPAFRPALARVGVASALAIPLRSRGRTIGAISLLRSRPGMPYTVDDQRLAQDLADRAGLAIDNAVLVGTLEQRVEERTAALETANHELEAFSYSVSHDLRTPLRAIDGFSRVLLADHADQLDDRGQHYLARILAATARMSGLIDDLLNLARIARMRPAVAPLDLSALATEVITEIQRREPARTIAVHITPGLSALADARLLKIMFENLLGNAWKFTAKHAHAEIWFGADGAIFYVRDTGAGFDMAHARKLFQPFQRLHAAAEYDGSGIGLATVHRIVTHHGGRIWAEAEVGKGATFFFTLSEPRSRTISTTLSGRR